MQLHRGSEGERSKNAGGIKPDVSFSFENVEGSLEVYQDSGIVTGRRKDERRLPFTIS